jgi:signal peptidase I
MLTLNLVNRLKLHGNVDYYLRGCLRVVGFFLIALFIKSTLVGFFLIPTISMEDSIIAGDFILVNKAKYGPIVFDINTAPAPRLSGYSYVERKDIVIFKDPLNENNTLIKRCVGLPGDTLKIVDNIIFINHNEIVDEVSVQHYFELTVPFRESTYYRDSINRSLNKRVVVNQWSKNEVEVILKLELSQVELKEFQKNFPHAYLRKQIERNKQNLYPSEMRGEWTLSNFGPIKIPKKGERIKLDLNNFHLLSPLITKYESKEKVRIDSYYTFEKNYYFLVGDHRLNAIDSRHFGPIPEDQIEGRAEIVLFNRKLRGRVAQRIL